MTTPQICVASAPEVTAAQLYKILQLRGEVFNVEQRCTDNDVDGRDIEPATVHYWIERGDEVVSFLRVLGGEGADHWIGRVCTSKAARGDRLAGALVSRVIEDFGNQRLLMHAQSYLVDWYKKFGFEVSGEEFDEAGMPHREMIRQPAT